MVHCIETMFRAPGQEIRITIVGDIKWLILTYVVVLGLPTVLGTTIETIYNRVSV